MKHFLIILLLLTSTQSFAQQQPYWHNIASGTHKKLLSISFGNVRTGYIGGVDSLFLKTSDCGESWQNISLNGVLLSAAASDIVDVNFVSGDIGYITVTNSGFPLY